MITIKVDKIKQLAVQYISNKKVFLPITECPKLIWNDF